MKYLNKSFSVGGANVSQEEWDRIFARRPKRRVRRAPRQQAECSGLRCAAGGDCPKCDGCFHCDGQPLPLGDTCVYCGREGTAL